MGGVRGAVIGSGRVIVEGMGSERVSGVRDGVMGNARIIGIRDV